MADPTYRASMLPIGTYANPDGTESLGWAVPGMIQEPLNALTRLFGSGNFAQGPDYPGNADDMRTLLFSMYGGNALNPAAVIPKGGLASGIVREAAEAAPQRMYHGTGVPEDISTFQPSAKGSLGPGVYLSKEADTTLPWANNGPNPRIMPVDVSGPIATYDDYLSARAAAPDQAATIQALMDQGYSGAAMDVPGKSGNMNVTNVFKPGSIRSATTGETLYSDTGRPSLMGSAIVGAEGNTQLRGYRGGIKPEHVLPPEDHRTFWGSSAPEVANTYAGLRPNGDIDKIVAPRIEEVGGRQAVAPADFNFSNPMTVDAGGAQWDRIPFENKTWATSDQLAQIARDRGHDGLILNNILDSAFAFGDHTPGNTYAALKRGTVTSPLTGETLFSDTGLPSIWGSAAPSQPASPQGQLTAGNIDLGARPVVANPDGSYSTVRSISVDDNGKTVLIPTVSDDGRIMSNQDAIQQYLHSGRHLGMFDSQANADTYGEQLHEDQARRYTPEMALPTTMIPTLPEAGTPYPAPRNSLFGSALYPNQDQEPRNALLNY